MARTDNYLIQAQYSKELLSDSRCGSAGEKLNAALDATFFWYTTFFGQSYQVSQETRDIQRLENGAWQDGNS